MKIGKNILFSHILILIPIIIAIAGFNSSYAQDNGKIKLIYAKTVMDADGYKNTTLAKGNVQFESDGTKFFCDSALWFRDQALVHAYGKVQINQGDTVNLFCDSLKYNDKTKISKLMSNVRLRDNEYKLLTDSLEYDGNQSLGYYKNWATITSIQQDLVLTSVKGYYYSNFKSFFFKDSVHITHPDYEMFSDTLEFNTNTSTAYFHGPTQIFIDSTKIVCTKGIYQTESGLIRLWNGANIYESSRNFYADSISYNEQSGIGEGFCNVDMLDTTENIRFLSDYLWKSAGNDSIRLQDNALVVQYGDPDTLYLSADTIFHHQDTLTHHKTSLAYKNVTIINGDLFVICDSAYFSEKDSILKLHKEPILWNEKSQMTADSVFAEYYDDAFHRMFLYENAMIISEHDDSVHYDQIKGKQMTAWLDSSKIKKIYIESNAQTLYYVSEDKKDTLGNEYKELSGMNRIDCNEIFLYFKDGEVDDIAFVDHPTSIYYPIEQVPSKELFLKGFLWEIDRKPDRIILE